MGDKTFHAAMYPWFAIGHLTYFLHLSNKLAERGHKISFFLPNKTIPKLQHFNLHPHLITFIPITVPHVEGLPFGTESTIDVPSPYHTHLMTAMDLTQPTIEASLRQLKPQFVFFDFAYWVPSVARLLGIKSFLFCTVTPAAAGYMLSRTRKLGEKQVMEANMREAPQGFPSSVIKLHPHEARELVDFTVKEFGSGIPFAERCYMCLSECDAIVLKGCREMEGPFCDYLQAQFKKPIILAGPVLPEPPTSPLEERWVKWLDGFKPKSVIFCSFGSECRLQKDQFQQLILGFELTGQPFFVALKPPIGFETIESALPDGFEERSRGRGVVHGGWVQQQLILGHPSVGCFVTHCGTGSLSEGMVNECQLVFLPRVGDQIINARLMGGHLKVGVEVEKGKEDGMFTKDGVCKAVRSVMEVNSEVGKEVRANHAKWRELLLSKGLESSCVDGFVQNLQALLDEP